LLPLKPAGERESATGHQRDEGDLPLTAEPPRLSSVSVAPYDRRRYQLRRPFKARSLQVDELEDRLANLYVAACDLDPAALKRATTTLQAELNDARKALAHYKDLQIRRELTAEWFAEVHGRFIKFIESEDLEQVVSLLAMKVYLTGDLTFDIKLDPSPETVRSRFIE
jgi:aminopeptidase N